MQWSERDTGWAWAALAEEHYGRMVEPDPLRRSLDILRTLPRLDDLQALDTFLRQQEADSAAMDDHTRQRLFDEWFAEAYTTDGG
jgi:hypothetical protein